mmetsp:Transcript_43686/g.127134  ORF Transcript_43686/g.127134 Transcript_43686/m.127134 type:complete len:375 (+) Transcript_43686:182-1306(+)
MAKRKREELPQVAAAVGREGETPQAPPPQRPAGGLPVDAAKAPKASRTGEPTPRVDSASRPAAATSSPPQPRPRDAAKEPQAATPSTLSGAGNPPAPLQQRRPPGGAPSDTARARKAARTSEPRARDDPASRQASVLSSAPRPQRTPDDAAKAIAPPVPPTQRPSVGGTPGDAAKARNVGSAGEPKTQATRSGSQPAAASSSQAPKSHHRGGDAPKALESSGVPGQDAGRRAPAKKRPAAGSGIAEAPSPPPAALCVPAPASAGAMASATAAARASEGGSTPQAVGAGAGVRARPAEQAGAKPVEQTSARQRQATLVLADTLIEGPPGTATAEPIPLRVLTKHRSVAWQWKVKGEWQYPIPIGCTRPLSPFSSN